MTPMVQVSPKLMEKRLIKKVAPEYPEQGQGRAEVVFEAVINKSGKVASLNAVSGPRKFMEAASDAVREYVYTPYVMDNGERAFVKTTIKVNFAPTHNK